MINDEQPENISLISVTFTQEKVLNLERSRVVKEEQPLNIPHIFVTCEVAKLERSRVVNDEQPENILLILVT